jgi:hypothetical protein
VASVPPVTRPAEHSQRDMSAFLGTDLGITSGLFVIRAHSKHRATSASLSLWHMKSAHFKYFLALCPVGMPPISFCVIAYLNIHYFPCDGGFGLF